MTWWFFAFQVIKRQQLSWKRKFATVKSLKADVSSVSSSSERLEELCVVCVYMQKMELRYW